MKILRRQKKEVKQLRNAPTIESEYPKQQDEHDETSSTLKKTKRLNLVSRKDTDNRQIAGEQTDGGREQDSDVLDAPEQTIVRPNHEAALQVEEEERPQPGAHWEGYVDAHDHEEQQSESGTRPQDENGESLPVGLPLIAVDEDDSSVVDAEHVVVVSRNNIIQKNEKKIKIVVGLIVALVFIIALVVGLTVNFQPIRSSSSTTSAVTTPGPTTTVPSSSPSRSMSPSFLGESLVEEIEARLSPAIVFDDDSPLSPQQQALQWLLNDTYSLNTTMDRQIQRFALATLYFSIGGPSWRDESRSTWLTPNLECDWEATFIACDNDLIVTMVRRDDVVGLSGTIPLEIGLLTGLRGLGMGQYGLRGSIPSQLGLLTNLSWLRLETASLTGTLPTALGQLVKLETFQIEDNNLSGPFPSEMGQLTLLQTLYLNDNSLTGTIPSSLCTTSQLEITIDCGELVCSCCFSGSNANFNQPCE